MKKLFLIFIFFYLSINITLAEENKMILKLKDGEVEIELFPKVAPNHVKRFQTLADEGK
jgi:hypothetical protein